jgi:DHA3 family tetracycline resistance protein-like MFS transporter
MAWLNRQIDGRARATILSAMSQANAFGQIGGGPAVGALGTAVSLPAALVASGLLLLPAVALYGRFARRAAAVPLAALDVEPSV